MTETHLKSAAGYLSAVAIGIGAALLLKSQSSSADGASAFQQTTKRERTTTALSGEQLLEAVADGVKKEDAEKNSPDDSHRLFKELLNQLPPTAHPQATYVELLDRLEKAELIRLETLDSGEAFKHLAELGVRFQQWFQVDPKAAMAFLGTGRQLASTMASYYVGIIAQEAYAAQGLRKSMDWIQEISPNFRWFTYSTILADVGKRGSIEDLQWLKENYGKITSDRNFARLGDQLGQAWPLERRDELIGVVDGQFAAEAILGIAGRMEGKEGLDWVKSHLESGQLSPELIKQLSYYFDYSGLGKKKDLSLEDKVSLVQLLKKERGTPIRQIESGLISEELGRFMRSNGDWLTSFRHGLVSADEVLKAALAASSDLGESKDQLRDQLFAHLAEDNATAAMSLLSGLPETEKTKVMVNAVENTFRQVNPDDFYQFISTIPYQNDVPTESKLRNAWKGRTVENLERFGENYFAWVQALPKGQHKTWALESLRDVSNNQYPWINREVKLLLEPNSK